MNKFNLLLVIYLVHVCVTFPMKQDLVVLNKTQSKKQKIENEYCSLSDNDLKNLSELSRSYCLIRNRLCEQKRYPRIMGPQTAQAITFWCNWVKQYLRESLKDINYLRQYVAFDDVEHLKFKCEELPVIKILSNKDHYFLNVALECGLDTNKVEFHYYEYGSLYFKDLLCTKLLLKYIAAKDIKDNEGNTPLHEVMAGQNRYHADYVKLFLDSHIDPNVTNSSGQTPLHELIHLAHQYDGSVNWEKEQIAVIHERLKQKARYLLEAGADVHLKTNGRKSSYDELKARLKVLNGLGSTDEMLEMLKEVFDEHLKKINKN